MLALAHCKPDNDLGKVWHPDQPHVAVRQLRDWFAQ
jgi:hypothetical protein